MALINCPECGKEISDKVKACPNCGYPLENETPGDEAEQKPQPVEVTAINLGDPKKKKTVLAVIIIAIVAIAAIVIGVLTYQAKQKAAAEAAAEAAAIAAHNDYVDTITAAKIAMLSNGAKAEDLFNLIHDVWYNTIYEESSLKTDKYTKTNSRFNDDFNDSLNKLFSDKDFLASVSKLEDANEIVPDLMKSLQSPTEEFRDCYNTLNELYTAYNTLIGLATRPSGSLTSYTESGRTCVGNFMTAYKTLELQIPDKIETESEPLPTATAPVE